MNTAAITLTHAQAWMLLSGVGTVLTAMIGIGYFKEPATALKMASIGLIVIGVMGLHSASRLSSP